ncbi:hypothetical protein NDA14_006094 [Ustilago hordei]|nr:hypothetical protein NDA14_006094 [Ustilago hordei]
MPNIFASPHLSHMWELPDFPLADNATAQQVMTLMDSLALKIHPEGYWHLSWVTSVSNVIIFLFIAMAMRIYRSQKSPVPLWLFKLEQRPYKVWRRRKSNSNPNRKARFWKPFRSSIANATSAAEKATATTDASNTDRGEESETRMGSFITASCVNCHLVLTSGYVLLFFVRVIEGYVTRDASDSPPLIEPFMIDAAMQAAIFSTAYFAALGYIAILLPNIPPWIWNNTVISVYATTILVGLVCLISIAASASKINYYRTLAYNDLFTLPSLFNSISTVEGTINSAAIQIARVAYKEAMDQRVWLLGAHGLVSIGGILLSLAYLLIFVTLTKKVAGELVQLRHEPPQGRGHALSSQVGNNVVTTWPSAAVPYSAPAWQPNTFLAQPNRFSLPLRMAVRTPPPTPAPKGPLPLPPARTPTSSTWRFSASDSIGHDTREVIAHASIPMLRAKSSMSSITEYGIATRTRGSVQQHTVVREASQTSFPPTLEQFREDSNQAILDRTHCTSYAHSSSHSIEEDEELHLGPRIRLDSQPTPWVIDTLHEDLASNEGYVAVCRFLFNCIIDHLALTLQCFAFGVYSIYLCIIFSKDYPYDAQKASMQAARVNMVFSCFFTLLYLVNSLNLFAPFLLFPASQVKLATMLASLTSPNARLHLDGSGERRKIGTKKAKIGNNRNSTRLDRKESSKQLLTSGGKVRSDTYSERQYRNPDPLPTHPYSAGYHPSNNHATMQHSVGGLASMQAIKRVEEEEEGDVVAIKASSAPVKKIVAAVKIFHPRPTSPSSTETLPKPTEDQGQANGLGLFSTIVKHTPFSSLLTGCNRPSSFPFATQTTPEPNPTYPKSSTEVTRRPTKGRQLVLDSLISSHALPIQGFYCHHSTASSNTKGVGVNMLQVNEMVELGLTPSRYEATLACQNSKQQEVQEELECLPSTTPTSRGVWMGKESNQRRQKFRQQLRGQVVQESQILSPLSPTCLNVKDDEQESVEEGARGRSSSCLTRGPISPKTPTTPNPIQEEKDREQGETHISLPLSPFPPSEESERSTSSDNAFLRAYKAADSVGGNKDEEEEEEEEEGTFGGSF